MLIRLITTLLLLISLAFAQCDITDIILTDVACTGDSTFTALVMIEYDEPGDTLYVEYAGKLWYKFVPLGSPEIVELSGLPADGGSHKVFAKFDDGCTLRKEDVVKAPSAFECNIFSMDVEVTSETTADGLTFNIYFPEPAQGVTIYFLKDWWTIDSIYLEEPVQNLTYSTPIPECSSSDFEVYMGDEFLYMATAGAPCKPTGMKVFDAFSGKFLGIFKNRTFVSGYPNVQLFAVWDGKWSKVARRNH